MDQKLIKLVEEVDDGFMRLRETEHIDNRKEIINEIRTGWLLIKQELE